MIKHLLITSAALGLLLSPALAAETAADKAKAAADKAAETAKKPADTTKKKAEEPKKEPKKEPEKKAEKKPAEKKPADKKPGELSESDQALVAHAEKESAKLTDLQSKKLLDLVNAGDDTAIQAIPGVGDVKAKAIKQARPLKSVAALIMVDGIGEGTFDDIVKWTKDGMKSEAPAEKPAAKPTDKPAAKEKDAPKKPAKETAPTKPAEKTAPAKKLN